jgi:hypothetical protein
MTILTISIRIASHAIINAIVDIIIMAMDIIIMVMDDKGICREFSLVGHLGYDFPL